VELGTAVFGVKKIYSVLMLRVFVNVNINTPYVKEILCHTFVQFGNGTQGLRI
jgi:hypothetical protein